MWNVKSKVVYPPPWILSVRMALAFALGLTVPACGGGGGGGGGAPPATVLFSDDFAGAFPGTTWIISAGSPVISSSTGNPIPSLFIPSSPGGNVRTSATFDASQGLTMQVELEGTIDQMFFDVVDIGAPSSQVARVSFQGSNTDYIIGAASVSTPYGDNVGAFHRYAFKVDSSGTAQWLRDGSIQFQGAVSQPLTLFVRLHIIPGSSGGYYDNVLVSNP